MSRRASDTVMGFAIVACVFAVLFGPALYTAASKPAYQEARYADQN